MQGLRYLPEVTTLHLDETLCNGCGVCQTVCPQAVFQMEGRKARVVDRDACIECGACALNCTQDAISVHAGVGCAAAIIKGWVTGKEPSCGCSGC